MRLVYLVLGSISARWDQSRMQPVVAVIAASAGAQPGLARPFAVLCIREIRPYHTQMQTL